MAVGVQLLSLFLRGKVPEPFIELGEVRVLLADVIASDYGEAAMQRDCFLFRGKNPVGAPFAQGLDKSFGAKSGTGGECLQGLIRPVVLVFHV